MYYRSLLRSTGSVIARYSAVLPRRTSIQDRKSRDKFKRESIQGSLARMRLVHRGMCRRRARKREIFYFWIFGDGCGKNNTRAGDIIVIGLLGGTRETVRQLGVFFFVRAQRVCLAWRGNEVGMELKLIVATKELWKQNTVDD